MSGNHTYHHALLSKECEKNTLEEIEKTEEIIFKTAGYRTKLFRPPEGYVDEKVKKISKELGYSIIIWSIDTKDWEHAGVDLIVGNVERNAGDGDIILMHDYVSKPNTTIGALERVIKNLKNEGYTFVTVSELIARGG